MVLIAKGTHSCSNFFVWLLGGGYFDILEILNGHIQYEISLVLLLLED